MVLQSTNEDRSDCKVRRSDVDEIGIKHFASSAKRRILDAKSLSGRSLM